MIKLCRSDAVCRIRDYVCRGDDWRQKSYYSSVYDIGKEVNSIMRHMRGNYSVQLICTGIEPVGCKADIWRMAETVGRLC